MHIIVSPVGFPHRHPPLTHTISFALYPSVTIHISSQVRVTLLDEDWMLRSECGWESLRESRKEHLFKESSIILIGPLLEEGDWGGEKAKPVSQNRSHRKVSSSGCCSYSAVLADLVYFLLFVGIGVFLCQFSFDNFHFHSPSYCLNVSFCFLYPWG